ncbi:MAG: hypothetical protein AAGD38_15140, partial [Acidobacteriota bacterium]
NAGIRYQQLYGQQVANRRHHDSLYGQRPIYVIAQPQPTTPQVVYVESAPQPPVYVVIERPEEQSTVETAPPPVMAPLPPPDPAIDGAASFHIVPSDSKVYLDDRLLGTASELASKGRLPLDAGVHVLEISHPDYATERVIFGVDGDHTTITVDLNETRPSRRLRLEQGG